MSKRHRSPGPKPHPFERKGLLYTVYFVLRVLVILMLVAAVFNQNYENVALCVLTLVLFMLPSAFERRLRIELPDTLEIIILLFIFAAEILGEIQDYYITFPYWDTMLHTTNGFLCAAIGFALVDILNRTERVSLNLSPFYMAVVAFCFSMTVGVMWEFFEFAMDHFLHFRHAERHHFERLFHGESGPQPRHHRHHGGRHPGRDSGDGGRHPARLGVGRIPGYRPH